MLAKAVHLFAIAVPDMITAPRASALLPYLQAKGTVSIRPRLVDGRHANGPFNVSTMTFS